MSGFFLTEAHLGDSSGSPGGGGGGLVQISSPYDFFQHFQCNASQPTGTPVSNCASQLPDRQADPSMSNSPGRPDACHHHGVLRELNSNHILNFSRASRASSADTDLLSLNCSVLFDLIIEMEPSAQQDPNQFCLRC